MFDEWPEELSERNFSTARNFSTVGASHSMNWYMASTAGRALSTLLPIRPP
jgi:hypothetical protein